MADQPGSYDIELGTFLRAAGQSFADAQKALLPGVDVAVNMMLNNAEIELKVAVGTDSLGNMTIRPISSQEVFGGGIDAAMLSTVRINFVSSISELQEIPGKTSTANGVATVVRVPSLAGLTLDQATALLKAEGWQFEPHAAAIDEIMPEDSGSRGQVIRQQPPADETADKTAIKLQFWVDLGSTPVKEIDGIGDKVSESLSKIGIRSVGDLSLADVSQVASLLRINETRARSFVEMADLMSRLTILGLKDEIVEVLAKGVGIGSVEQLTAADPETLYRECKQAISEGKVRVPREFKFTATDVKHWIEAAGNKTVG